MCLSVCVFECASDCLNVCLDVAVAVVRGVAVVAVVRVVAVVGVVDDSPSNSFFFVSGRSSSSSTSSPPSRQHSCKGSLSCPPLLTLYSLSSQSLRFQLVCSQLQKPGFYLPGLWGCGCEYLPMSDLYKCR